VQSCEIIPVGSFESILLPDGALELEGALITNGVAILDG
jgi:hypothetical protein